jgi:AraC-like DNA-binding protein
MISSQVQGAAILSKFNFNTDIYPAAERFDGWREEFARRVINSDIRRLDDAAQDDFYASTDIMQAGQIKIASSKRTQIEIVRSAAQAEQSDATVGLLVNMRGVFQASQDGLDTHVDGIGAQLMYNDRVNQLRVLAGEDGLSHIVSFTLPRRALLSAAPDALTRPGGRLNPDPSMLKYLIRYASDVAAPAPGTHGNPALAAAIGDHMLDLVALMLGPSRDAGEIASRRGLRAARLKSILAFVADNISDPALDVAMVARRHGIGTRYVSQLMEERGETLMRLIQRLRLERAAAMLNDPAARGLRIGEIAFACGFSDLSHFNRSFRRQYGETPKSYRT